MSTIDEINIQIGKVAEEIGKVAEEIGKVAEEIGKVAEKIGKVAEKIEKVETAIKELENDSEAKTNNQALWEKRLEQLQNEKKQLQDDKKQLQDDKKQQQDEKNKLLDEKNKLRDEKNKLRDEKNLLIQRQSVTMDVNVVDELRQKITENSQETKQMKIQLNQIKNPFISTDQEIMTTSGTQLFNLQCDLGNVKQVPWNEPPFKIDCDDDSLNFTDIRKNAFKQYAEKYFPVRKETSPLKQKGKQTSPTKQGQGQNSSPQTKKLKTETQNTQPETSMTIDIDKLPEIPLHCIFEELIKELFKTYDNVTFDALHEFMFKRKLKPDFTFREKNMPTIPFYCSFVAELQIKAFDLEHKGRMFQYHEMFMRANPCRQNITSLITNLKSTQIIKTEREKDTETLKHKLWEEIPFWPNENDPDNRRFGLRLLNMMIKNPKNVGYESGGIRFEINDKMFHIQNYLSEGSTAKTYSFRYWNQNQTEFDFSTDYVLKVFKNKKDFEGELETVEDIMNRFDKSNVATAKATFTMLKKISSSDQFKSIVYSPRGSQLKHLNQNRIKQMCECVLRLHEIGVIHRDISPNHFYVINPDTKDEQVFLIDYGSAYCMEVNKIPDLNQSNNIDTEFIDYNGSVQFAALEILKILEKGESLYKPKRKHDMESLIRTIMYFYHGLCFPAMPKNNEKYKNSIKYWNAIDDFLRLKGKFEFWESILSKVRGGEYSLNQIMKELEKLYFQKIDTEEIMNKLKIL